MRGTQIDGVWERRERLYLKKGKNNRRTEKSAYEEPHKFYSTLISNSTRKMKPEVKRLGRKRIRL
jgi:hypothetical protein